MGGRVGSGYCSMCVWWCYRLPRAWSAAACHVIAVPLHHVLYGTAACHVIYGTAACLPCRWVTSCRVATWTSGLSCPGTSAFHGRLAWSCNCGGASLVVHGAGTVWWYRGWHSLVVHFGCYSRVVQAAMVHRYISISIFPGRVGRGGRATFFP